MRPNTPVLSPVAEVADEMMEEEEDSDKENENPPTPHSSARPACVHDFSILPLLNALSLEDKTLELVRWCPSEGWAAFLEFRLRPMVYFVHAAVTHDFTLSRDYCSRPVALYVRCTWTTSASAIHPLSVCRGGDSDESWILNLDLLIPLVESARETRALLRTAFDYPAFDEHGQLLIPDFYSVEARPQDVSPERNIRGHPVSTR
ncbi:hypothetical protein B0H14DRAFT_3442285 [Mycena olivaceomarginata]|nr:hypothetical protein B0H14DRAFT_3442285 [Mycena olivaceomarginata]